ncbi:MAG: hemolysin activation/secretion protein [Paracoccaceae bacterium]
MKVCTSRLAALLAIILPCCALAQGAPIPSNPGAAIEAIRRAADPSLGPLGPSPQIAVTSQTPPANAAEISFTLTSVTLAGGTIYAPAALAPLYADSVGQVITVEDLFVIAARLQAQYRDDGYLFTRVLVPAQEIDSGAVRFELVEAVIEEVLIEEPAGPIGAVRALVERIVAPLIGLANPRLADIEAVLLRLNDIPGVIRAAAVPKLGGDTRGGIKLYVNMERNTLDVVAFVDNRQSPIIGTGLFGAVASWNSWTEAGDTTTLSIFGSGDFDDAFPRDFQERWTGQLEHSRFIGDRGLSLRLRGLYSRTRPGDSVRDFAIVGQQLELGAALVWPLVRSRALSIDVSGGLEVIEMDSVVPASGGGPGLVTADDSIRAMFASARLVQRDLFGVTEAEASLRAGLDFYGASRPDDAGLSRADGDGSFVLVRGQVSRTLTHQALAPFSFWAELRGQWADRPLLSSEEFSIGGPTLSRAYDPSEYAGDNGIGATAEIRIPAGFTLYDQLIDATLYAYGDAAEVGNLGGGTPIHQSLLSAGVGVRANLPAGFALNLEAAKPIDTPLARTSSDAWRFFFSASKRF